MHVSWRGSSGEHESPSSGVSSLLEPAGQPSSTDAHTLNASPSLDVHVPTEGQLGCTISPVDWVVVVAVVVVVVVVVGVVVVVVVGVVVVVVVVGESFPWVCPSR